ncbi:MAG: cytochrome P450 [Aestuariivita sp.]|nr:cytochrome P450 [Aestuariivita sp.]MCY4203919.1 cytochrome P450 [Aestuariivita sp.]
MKAISDLPSPKELPVLGHLHKIRFVRLHRIFEEWADAFGPIYRIKIGPRVMCVISDRELFQQILRQRPQKFQRLTALSSVAAEMRLDGVFTANGDDWKRQRQIVDAALNRAKLEDFFPKLMVYVGRLQSRWQQAAEQSRVVNVTEELIRFTVDVTMRLAFDLDANTLETSGPTIQRHLDKVFPILLRRINAPFPWWRYFRLPADRALDRALVALEGEVAEIVHHTRKRMQADQTRFTHPTNFLEALLAAVHDEASGFSEAEIFANVSNILLAGEDTTANSIAWALYFGLIYPDAFLRMREEVEALLGADNSLSSFDQAAKLPLMDAFCNESMRLTPVAPLHTVEPVEDIELLGYLIPKATPIFVLARHIAVSEESFADSKSFDLSRWLKAPSERTGMHNRRAFTPFGGGPRVCPGRSLAMLQFRAVLAMFCQNFQMEPEGDIAGVQEHLTFTMTPRNLRVRLKARLT